MEQHTEDVLIGPGLMTGRANTIGGESPLFVGTPRRIAMVEEVRKLEMLEQAAKAKRQKKEE